LEHGLRRALMAVWLGEELGLEPEELSDVYYVGLLGSVGCTLEAAVFSPYLKDEIAIGEQLNELDPTRRLEVARFFLSKAGEGEPPLRRAKKMLAVALQGPSGSAIVCRDVATQVGDMLEMGPAVRQAVGECHERWNGKGWPHGLMGEGISLPARMFILAHDVEFLSRTRGVDAALTAVRGRAGRLYDPRIADCFHRVGNQLVTRLHAAPAWEAVLAAEPAPVRLLSPQELDGMAEMIGDFIDVRSSYTVRHSHSVAALAEGGGRKLGLSNNETASLQLAGLLHDLGRASVPVTLWEKTNSLSETEWERMKKHPSMSELVLARSDALGHLGTLTGLHHERLDGSGYRRVSAASLPMTARILAVADAYQTKLEGRPHRSALTREAAAKEVQHAARHGELDSDAVSAVLEAAGNRVTIESKAAVRPGGLSERELEVLRLAIRGLSNRQIGEALFLSPKTVGHHIQHIYDKIGVSTRVGAMLFALQHHLIEEVA
jgi:HD-GYP domain-containing protein (c-di-GMP phosphodiesterase class II)